MNMITYLINLHNNTVWIVINFVYFALNKKFYLHIVYLHHVLLWFHETNYGNLCWQCVLFNWIQRLCWVKHLWKCIWQEVNLSLYNSSQPEG